MDRKLIIDGNAVYEIDEKCMLRKQLEEKKGQEQTKEDVEKILKILATDSKNETVSGQE